MFVKILVWYFRLGKDITEDDIRQDPAGEERVTGLSSVGVGVAECGDWPSALATYCVQVVVTGSETPIASQRCC